MKRNIITWGLIVALAALCAWLLFARRKPPLPPTEVHSTDTLVNEHYDTTIIQDKSAEAALLKDVNEWKRMAMDKQSLLDKAINNNTRLERRYKARIDSLTAAWLEQSALMAQVSFNRGKLSVLSYQGNEVVSQSFGSVGLPKWKLVATPSGVTLVKSRFPFALGAELEGMASRRIFPITDLQGCVLNPTIDLTGAVRATIRHGCWTGLVGVTTEKKIQAGVRVGLEF